jgi:hypothetical protein
MTGLPIEYYELPTKNTILRRIAIDPDERVWFTELGADRIGTIKFGAPRTHGNREASDTVQHNVEPMTPDQPPQPALRQSTQFQRTVDSSTELEVDGSGTIRFEASPNLENREASNTVQQNVEPMTPDQPPQPASRRATTPGLNDRMPAVGQRPSVRLRKARKFFSKATSVHGFFAPRPPSGAIP